MLTDFQCIKRFWIKRVTGILPMYWFVGSLFAFMMILFRTETLVQAIVLVPIEGIGIQSVFFSLFNVSHTGGTWFISCILICYAIYPFLQEIVKSISKRTRMILLISSVVILLYSPIVVYMFELETIYSNPFFRLLEFMIGMLLAAMKLDYKNSQFINKYIYSWRTIIAVNLIMVIAVTIAVNLNIAVGNYMMYSWICLPCFMLMLFGGSGVESKVLERFMILKWMSEISYVFFLAQLFSNRISKKLIAYGAVESNILKIMIGWGVCLAIAICFRFIEVWLNKYMRKLYFIER